MFWVFPFDYIWCLFIEKPHFRRTPLDQEVEQGATVRLYCAALGQPHPDITWSHDDIPIVPGDRLQVSTFFHYCQLQYFLSLKILQAVHFTFEKGVPTIAISL
jgi:hypothetical protein